MFKKPFCDDRDQDLTQSFIGDNDINMTVDVDMYQGMPMPMAGAAMNAGAMMGSASMGSVSAPIIEPMQEQVVNRTILHEVPHVCPRRTRIINNHVYRHTYRPHHTCCEENICTNVQCGSCCNGR